MAEQVSREAARLASSAAGGKVRAASNSQTDASVITGPATVTWASGDTMGNRVRIPAGSRILGALVSNGAAGAGITMNVGLRNFTTDGSGTVIDAAGVVSALSVASAQSSFVASGTFTASGAEYVTAVDSEAYLTLAGGTPAANTAVRVAVLYTTA